MDTNFIDKVTVILATWLQAINDYVFRRNVVFDNYSAIRANTNANARTGKVLCYSTLGDGRGGELYLDVSDTTSVDNDDTIIVDVLGGRWKRSFAQAVTSIAGLRRRLKTGAPTAFVTSYYGDGQSGGGSYYLDLSDTTSADNGGTIIVAVDGGRWKLTQNEPVSVTQFGARPTGLVDASTAFAASIAALGYIYSNGGSYLISTGLAADISAFRMFGKGTLRSTVASGYVLDLGHASLGSDLFDVEVTGWRFEKVSGTNDCIRARQCNLLSIQATVITGFTNYAIDLYGSDGAKIIRNRIASGSIRASYEMDELVIRDNEIQNSISKPCIEIYGGLSIDISNNFINWSQYEGIVIGYDSVRGDFANTLVIRSNYMERLCQTNTGSANRPFVHVGKPIDQTGAPYVGALVSTWVDVRNNYFNADITNANLANVIPIVFENALEVDWDNNRVVNFVSNNPRVKSPLRRLKMDTLENVTDISTSGNASIQVWRMPTSRYKTHEFYLARISVPTDGSGNGSFNASSLNTGLFGGFTTSDIYVEALPEADCRLSVPSKTISSGTAPDGSDQVSLTINVRGGPISSSVNVGVSAKIQIT